MTKDFSIRSTWKEAWGAYNSRFVFLLQLTLAAGIAMSFVDWLSQPQGGGQGALAPISFVLSVLVQAVGTHVAIRIARGEEVSWSSIWISFERLWKYFAASMLTAFAVFLPVILAAGIVFVLIGNAFITAVRSGGQELASEIGALLTEQGPIVAVLLLIGVAVSFALAIRLSFSTYFAVDRLTGPIESLKASYRATAGRYGTVILVLLSTVAAIILGMIALFVGLIVAVPVSMIVIAKTYEALSPHASAAVHESPVTTTTDVKE